MSQKPDRPALSRPPVARASATATVLWTGLAALLVLAGPARAETIDDSMARALKTNPKLKADAARQRASKADLTAAKAAFLPTVYASGDWTIRGDTTYMPRNPIKDPGNPYSYGITLSQPVFDGMKRVNDFKRARASVAAGAWVSQDTQQSVLLDAATSYIAILRDQDILRLREQAVALVSGVVQSVRFRVKAGESSPTDLAQAESRLELAKAELERARGELAASRSDYEKVTGSKPDALVRPLLPLPLLPKDAEEAAQIASQDNPKLGVAHFNAIAAGYAAKAVKAEFAPQVNLEVARTENYAYSFAYDRRQDTTVRLGVRIPLMSPTLAPRYTEAREVAIQKGYEAQDMKNAVVAAASSAFSRFQAADRRIAAIDRQVVAAQTAAGGILKEYELGARPVIDVLDADQEVVNAEVGLVTGRFERDYAAYILLATCGRLTASALGLIQTASK